jgi:hypothetical protein
MLTEWIVGNVLRCTFEVLLLTPSGGLVTDMVPFDCEIKHYEPGTFTSLPHWVLDCSESRNNKWLDLQMPIREVIEYEGSKNECR